MEWYIRIANVLQLSTFCSIFVLFNKNIYMYRDGFQIYKIIRNSMQNEKSVAIIQWHGFP